MISVAAPSGVTVSGVKIGDSVVNKTNNWSLAGGKLTFKSAYLSGLSNGNTVFTVVMSNGDTAEITIMVGA